MSISDFHFRNFRKIPYHSTFQNCFWIISWYGYGLRPGIIISKFQRIFEIRSRRFCPSHFSVLERRSKVSHVCIFADSNQEFMSHLERIHIPVWLLVSGCAVFFVPGVYFIYDKYCKDEHGGPLIKSAANCIVIFYLLCGLTWSVIGMNIFLRNSKLSHQISQFIP